MTLSRWSLPSRVFARDKQAQTGVNSQERSSTVHVGQPGLRQRGNLSNVFSTPFKKVENDRDGANEELDPTVARQPSPSYAVNTVHASSLGTTHVLEPPLTRAYGTSFLVDDPTHSRTGRIPRRVTPPFTPTPGAIGNLPYQHDQIPRWARSGNYLIGEGTSGSRTFAGSRESMKARMALEEVRSRSSSYPSEGMRSPTSSLQTPPPTSATDELIAEYVQCGSLPTRALQQTPNTSIDHWKSVPSVSGQDSAIKLTHKGNTSIPRENYYEHETAYSPLGIIAGENPRKLRAPGGAFLSSPSEVHTRDTGDVDLELPSEHKHQVYGQDVQGLGHESCPTPRSQTAGLESRNSRIQSNEPSSAGLGSRTTVDDHTPSIGYERRQEATTGTTGTLRSIRSVSTLALDSRGLDSLEMPMLCRSWPPANHTSDSIISQRIHQFKLKIQKIYKRSKLYFHHVEKPMVSSIAPPTKKMQAGRMNQRRIQARTHSSNRKSAKRLLTRIRREKKKARQKQKKAVKEIQDVEAVPGKRWAPTFIPPRKREMSGISHHHDTILKRAASCPILHKQWYKSQRRHPRDNLL